MTETEKSSKPNKESTASALTPPPPPRTPTPNPATVSSSSSTTNTTTSSSPDTSSATNSTTNSTTASTSASSSNSTANSTTSTGVSSTIKLPSKPPSPLPPPPPPPPKLLPPPAPVSRAKSHESSEPVIRKAFSDYMKDPECLDKAADYLYESLLEDAVMGVYLEVHQSLKSGCLEAVDGESEDDAAFKIVDTPNYDVFGMSSACKAMNCNCPNCDRLVAASKFAPHLEKCMGMGRKTSRVASRRLANAKEGSNSSYFSSNVSDDEDDADWSSEKRRKKIQTSRTNGSKKNGKSN